MPELAPQITCGSPGCTLPVAVQWRRRLTADELAAHAGTQGTLLAWAQYNAPDGAAVTQPSVQPEATRAVYGCTSHAISLDLAALIHAATCTAPPVCSCTPETTQPDGPADPVTLPPGWTT